METFVEVIDTDFPKLIGTVFSVTSPVTKEYNCIAWAVGDTERWWSNRPQYYWPVDAPRGSNVGCLVDAYRSLRFDRCDEDAVEEGFDKVAVYWNHNDGRWTHAARQLPNGCWTSKLGRFEDIQHEHPKHLEGPSYGSVYCYMKRPKESK